MTFNLHRSNRVERLADALAQLVREPLRDPLARECIVVQGPGMERWLSARLSTQLGVWANPWFPFPRALIELCLDAVLGSVPASAQLFRPELLTFRIAGCLDEKLDQPGFEEVARYVGRDRSNASKLALSGVLAGVFDQYLVYRPDLILGWEHGQETHFQAELWRSLVRGSPRTHIAKRMREFAGVLAQGPSSLAQAQQALPERISLFGVSSLPPAFLQVLTQIALHRDVHLFLLTPSPHYWGDFERRLSRGSGVPALLANLGRVGREFIELLLNEDAFDEPNPDLFELPQVELSAGASTFGSRADPRASTFGSRADPRASTTLLRQLQCDLANLTERGPGSADEPPCPVAATDTSLSVHVCHSPTRELEVLRDLLRARFEADRSLEPHDVVVFAPDIERYAPAIEAVFTQDGPDAIPFRIADRRSGHASALREALWALFDLLGSRLPLSEVLDFLHRVPVRERFDLAEQELESLQEWLVEAGARWAVDGKHRARFGQPPYHENSLRFALERMFVGYAGAAEEQRSVLGVLPYSDLEGEPTLWLGRFARFAESLFELVEASAQPLAVPDWCALLTRAASALFSDKNELGHEHAELQKSLAALAADARLANYGGLVPLEGFRALLEARLTRGRANLGFLSSGVTFCEHVPMRAIPFRVVCMVGMDDEAFPRRSRRPSFDLMGEARRQGDRDVRDDDRQLFLEALLSARDAVIISYLGRSAKDDSERPPSVLVDQLLRLIDRQFVVASAGPNLVLEFERKRVSEHVIKSHCLHRFDPRYFGPAAPAPCYDASAAAAARVLLAPRKQADSFVKEPLAAQLPDSLDLEELVRFYRSPQRAFVESRLRVRLPRDAQQILDREPTELDALERFRVHDLLLTQLANRDRAEQLRLLALKGRLPPGRTGEVLFEDLERTVQGMLAQLDVGTPAPELSLRIALPGPQGATRLLTGRLAGMHSSARLELTAAAARHKHKLSAWIRHLALCASGGPLQRSVLVARGDGESSRRGVAKIEFGPVPRASELLAELVALYELGMHMPLPLLPNLSSAYATALQQGKDDARALEHARMEQARPQRVPDSADGYVRQVWHEEQLERFELLAASDGTRSLDFPEVARRVLAPLLEHLATARELNSEA